MSFELKWDASITTSITKLEEGQSLPIQGELLDSSVNKNKWAVDAEELPKIANQVKRGVQLRVDHSNSVRDIIGGTNDGVFDSKTNKVNFGAEIDDPSIAMGVMKGRLKYVSIGASADPYCSKCGTRFKMFRECSCKGGHTIIKNVRIKEVSIVSDPAYSNSKFNPISFVASVDEALAQIKVNNEKEEKNMVEVKAESYSAEEIKEIARDVLTNEMSKLATDMFGPMKQEVSDISKSLGLILNERKEQLTKKEMAEKEEATKKREEELVKTITESVVKMVKEEFSKAEKPVEKEKEEEDEEEEDMKKKEETIVKGAKVEEEETEITAETTGLDSVWAEIKAAAEKFEII